MKKLIPIEERESELIRFGAPKSFIKHIGKIPERQFRIEDVEGAYFYLPQISDYEILKGLNIIPIYDEGDSFRVFGYNDTTQKIFHFELENDEIYDDYGNNWNLLLLDIMIEYFDDDIDDEINIETFKKVGDQLGFDKSESLFKLLLPSKEEYNEKYSNLDLWRKELAEELNIQ